MFCKCWRFPAGLSIDPTEILSRVYEELKYEFEKTLKPADTNPATASGTSASTPDVNASTPDVSASGDSKREGIQENKISQRDSNDREAKQSSPASKPAGKSLGGILSCFRGSKVTDENKDDVYEKSKTDEGKIDNFAPL